MFAKSLQGLRMVAVSALLLSSCMTAQGPFQTAVQGKVTRPGVVHVDVEQRVAYLKGNPESWCDKKGSVVAPILEVKGSTSYGIDMSYYRAYAEIMQMTAGCLDGDDGQCTNILEMVSAWAEAGAAMKKTGFSATKHIWNDTLTINTFVIKPFLTAYAVARTKLGITGNDEVVRNWFRELVLSNDHRMRNDPLSFGSAPRAAQNHAVASSGAWMAYGAMYGDDRSFQNGIDQWFITLDSMRSDGSLPAEARRGSKATMYSALTINGLVSIAEMARLQGIDLYGQAPAPGKTIHKAIEFLVAAMFDSEVILKYAKEDYISGSTMSYQTQDVRYFCYPWLYPYVSRFPDMPAARNARAAFVVPFMRTDSEWIGGDAQCLWREF